MQKVVLKSVVLLMLVFLVGLCSANVTSAKEYWGTDAERMIKGSVDITNAKGFSISKRKITITDYDGQKKTYRISKKIVRLGQLASCPMGFETMKSSKKKFRSWMQDVITDNCNGLGCMIVVKKGVIVRYYWAS